MFWRSLSAQQVLSIFEISVFAAISKYAHQIDNQSKFNLSEIETLTRNDNLEYTKTMMYTLQNFEKCSRKHYTLLSITDDDDKQLFWIIIKPMKNFLNI